MLQEASPLRDSLTNGSETCCAAKTRQEDASDSNSSKAHASKRDLRFWMCFVSLILPTFSVALDVAAVSTPLPLIVKDLKGQEFEWVGSAYALASTAFLPLWGGLAQVFGRRFVMMFSLFLFAAGSAICGASPTLNVLIFSRSVQGIGAGGILSVGQIILGDLVALRERGIFNAFFSVAYALSTSAAPIVGGALAQIGQWRWIFYLNIPICGVSALIASIFLNLKTPRGTWKEKIARLDWAGHILVMGSTTACVIGLTWGGVQFAWASPRVLVPLIVGLIGIVAFMIFEAKIPKEPLVPPTVLSNRTAISGYIQCFITSFMSLSTTYYLPVYYQACKGASLTGSAIDSFGYAQPITPFAFIASIVMTRTGRFRPPLWFAWVMSVLGSALFSTVDVNTSRATSIGYQIILALAHGPLFAAAVFPVLSALPVTLNAPALAFYAFIRYFAQVWGITVGGTALQNRLTTQLPAGFLKRFPGGTSVAYSVIPVIGTLPEPLQRQVRDAFAEGLRAQWLVLTGMSVLGLVSSLFMKGMPLHEEVDEDWTLQDSESGGEKSVA